MTQGHQNSCYLIGHCYVSVLHHFQEITTVTVPVALKSPSVSIRQLKLQAIRQVHCLIHVKS